jgi:hypothetical protein
MATGLLILLTLVIRLFPDTPAGKWLHFHVVELSLKTLEKFELKYLILVPLIPILAYGFALSLPVDLAMIMALDMTLYVDIMMAGYAASIGLRTRAMMDRLRLTISAFLKLPAKMRKSKPRAKANKRVKKPMTVAENDNDDGREQSLILRVA